MKFIKTKLEGVFIVENRVLGDARGTFVKHFSLSTFRERKLCTEFKESYSSESHRGVVRGMHFQLPPDDHEKLVYVPHGKILDVVLDIRAKSPTFGQVVSAELSAENGKSMYLPRGCAHGFRSLGDGSIVVYDVATEYAPRNDAGIRWDSFGFDWGIDDPIMSERDRAFPTLASFETRF